MKITKKAVLAAVLGVVGTGVVTATALAATSSTDTKYPSIVQKIADKFHLNPADVQSVFDQNRQDIQAQHQQKLKSTLDQVVKDGKITQDQADKLLAKLNSLHDQFKNDNREERMQNRQQLHDELEQWAKDNGINNLDDILPHPLMGRHHMMQ
ncbi:MAG TPA: hypothetical protein VLE51_03050 [Candidatus Saccharimonadales bacterium]|nr:hypothetical protein [Candidatus Saccharimonadales bacterium]